MTDAALQNGWQPKAGFTAKSSGVGIGNVTQPSSRWRAPALMMLAVMAACGRQAGGAGALLGQHSADRAKLNAYTEGYNVVLGNFGLRTQVENYARGHIAGPSPEPDYVILNNGWLEQARTQLKAGRAMAAGSLGEVDTAADRFIPALDKVMAHETELSSYYTSKAWRDDGLARGKREDPILMAEFQTALREGDRFEVAMTKARDAREAAELSRLKNSRDDLGYDTALALHQARALVRAFGSEAALHDPKRMAAADAQAPDLQKTLADQHAQIAKAKAKRGGSASGSIGMADFRVDALGRASDALDGMLGHYRDLKAGGGVNAYNAMVSSFNEAIGDSNSAVTTS